MPKRIALCVFFAIGQASVPIPGQTTDHATRSASGVNNNTKGHKNPTTSPSTNIQAVQSDPKGDAGQSKTTDNKPQSVAIRELPAMSVSKDWADWGYWGFGGLLVIVGFLQVHLIRQQARTMEKQVKVMDKQTVIMTAQHDQWVDLRMWSTGNPIGKELPISVELVNETSLPMTVNGELTIENPETPRRYSVFHPKEPIYLTPRKPITIELGVVITDRQRECNKLVLTIKAKFSHIHKITDVEVPEVFEGWLECGPLPESGEWVAHYTSNRRLVLEAEKSKDPQNKNPT